MKNNHFNKGFVFGRLAGLKQKISKKKVKYLSIYAQCPNNLHGDAKAYGNLWGNDKVDAFMDSMKKDGKLLMGNAAELIGFFKQYDHKGKRLNNYHFYGAQPYEGNEYRAIFILAGEIVHIFEQGDEGCIHLHISRRGEKGETVEEDFQLFTEDKSMIKELRPGQTAKLKGLISEKGEADYFGDRSGIFKPYVKEIKILATDS